MPFNLIHQANARLDGLEEGIEAAQIALDALTQAVADLQVKLDALTPQVELTPRSLDEAKAVKVANVLVLSGAAAALVNNTRTRVDEIEAALRQAGVLA